MKFLYVLGKEYPLKFFGSRRSVASVMGRNSKLWAEFQNRYDNQFLTVREYYSYKHNDVRIEDVGAIVPSEDGLFPDKHLSGGCAARCAERLRLSGLRLFSE
jgi:hypothetical protein